MKKKASRQKQKQNCQKIERPIQTGLFSLMSNMLRGTQESLDALLALSADNLPESLARQGLLRDGKIVLEASEPLSKSLLWQIQENYYHGQSISAWNNTVPFLVTNSTFIAEAYGDLLVAYLRDALPTLNTEAPLYIVEISAGTGRFSYYLLRELQRKLDLWPALANLDIRYVMTDISGETIDFWQRHERLRPFIDKGMLDFAVFRPEQEQSLQLVNSQETLAAGHFENPMVVIANYLFDTVRHDLFRAENGTLSEGRVSLVMRPESLQTSAFCATGNIGDLKIDEVETHVDYHPLADANYYREDMRADTCDSLNAVLRSYAKSSVSKDAFNFIFPIGAFDCLRNLDVISGGNFAVFASDKGYTSIEAMSLRTEHGFAAHGGFSYPVNFDAINRFCKRRGDAVFCSSGHSNKLHTVCYIHTDAQKNSGGEAVGSKPLRNLAYVFEEKINRNRPASALLDVLVLSSIQHEQLSKEPSLRRMLGLFQATYYEPTTFCNCGKALLDVLPKATPPEICELLEVMNRVWENDYFFVGECNLAFWLSQVFFSLGFYKKSLYFLEEAERRFGVHEALHYLKGNCHEKLSQPELAKSSYHEALMLKPGFSDAQKRLDAIAAAS